MSLWCACLAACGAARYTHGKTQLESRRKGKISEKVQLGHLGESAALVAVAKEEVEAR